MSDILGFFDSDQYYGYMDIQEFFKKADRLFFHHIGKHLDHLQKTIKGFGQGKYTDMAEKWLIMKVI